MSSRRTTSEPTVGRHVMRMLVSTEKHGDMIISGRRPIASESPPKIGETMKPSTPAIDSRLPCARACAASVRSSFSEAQEKTKRAAVLTIAGVVVEPDLRLGLHAHHDAEGCAAAALDFFERRRKGSGALTAAHHTQHQRLHRHLVRLLRGLLLRGFRRLLLVLLRRLGLVEDVAGRDGGRAARPDRHGGALQS